jgi:hypothetical protein
MIRDICRCDDMGRMTEKNTRLLAAYYNAAQMSPRDTNFNAVVSRMRVKVANNESRPPTRAEIDVLRRIISARFQRDTEKNSVDMCPDPMAGIDYEVLHVEEVIAKYSLTDADREVLAAAKRSLQPTRLL